MWQPQRSTKPRLIVLTDMTSIEAGVREPDDGQSLVRLLHYANEIDIEGLIAGSNLHHNQVTRPELIHKVLDAYATDQPGLAKHAKFPPVEQLRAGVFGGQPNADKDLPVEKSVGKGMETPASKHLIACVDRDDARPIWISVWGGTADLAQALWTVEHERSPAELAKFIAKLRVHAIADQDSTAVWIKERYPNLFYATRTWAYRGMYRGGDTSLCNGEWVNHVVHDSGSALGALYPNYAGGDIWSNKLGNVHGVKEGDTPSYLNLIDNGLSDDSDPAWNHTWGGWGGRLAGKDFRWGDDPTDGTPQPGDPDPRMVGVHQWRPAFQADFAARLKWATLSPEKVSYPSVIRVKGGLQRRAKVGETVKLEAFTHGDVTWRWSIERGNAELHDANASGASLVPTAAGEVHAIVAGTQNGLSRYVRVVVTVSA